MNLGPRHLLLTLGLGICLKNTIRSLTHSAYKNIEVIKNTVGPYTLKSWEFNTVVTEKLSSYDHTKQKL